MTTESYVAFDLSQIAASISLSFLRLSREEKRDCTQVAKQALGLYEAITAAQAIASDEKGDDLPSAEAIPAARRSMLLAKRMSRDPEAGRYRAVVEYSRKHGDKLCAIASGALQPNADEIEQLRSHFASTAIVLSNADL